MVPKFQQSNGALGGTGIQSAPPQEVSDSQCKLGSLNPYKRKAVETQDYGIFLRWHIGDQDDSWD